MSAMCNKCGIQFDSSFCPNCGTPNKPQGQPSSFPPPVPPSMSPQKKKKSVGFYILIAFGVLMFIGIVGSMMDSQSDTDLSAVESHNKMAEDKLDPDKEEPDKATPTKAPTPTDIPYIKTTSTELITAYKENQVKCKQLYDKELLEVTGTVQSIGTDILDNTYVSLGSDDEFTFVGIQCYAKNNDEINKIAELKEGDIITVRGKANCGSLSFSLDKAEILAQD